MTARLGMPENGIWPSKGRLKHYELPWCNDKRKLCIDFKNEIRAPLAEVDKFRYTRLSLFGPLCIKSLAYDF